MVCGMMATEEVQYSRFVGALGLIQKGAGHGGWRKISLIADLSTSASLTAGLSACFAE